MTKLAVAPLDDTLSFGARVTGVTRENVNDQAVRDQILEVFNDAGVVVFDKVEPSTDMQLAISAILGPLRNHAMPDSPSADVGAAAKLLELHNDPGEQSLYRVNGEVRAGCTPWHYDACYSPQIYRGGVLRALLIAPEGGFTGFADGIQMYEALSPAMRARFEDIEIVYDAGLMHDRQKFGLPKDYEILHTQKEMAQAMTAYEKSPRAIHPAIWERPDGRRVLHVSPWQAAGIHGQENAEGDALLEALCQEMVAVMKPYWHAWHEDEIVAWDNWRTIHAVSGHNPEYGRKVHRATIEGDYGLGRAEFPEPAEA